MLEMVPLLPRINHVKRICSCASKGRRFVRRREKNLLKTTVRIQVVETLAWIAFQIRTSRINKLIFSTSNEKWPLHRFLLKIRTSWILLQTFTGKAFQSFPHDLNPYNSISIHFSFQSFGKSFLKLFMSIFTAT